MLYDFPEHGEFIMRREDQLIISNCKGPFNKKLIDRYIKEKNELIEELDGAQFIDIILLNDEGIFPPDSIDDLKKIYKELFNLGLLKAIYVFNERINALSFYQLKKILSENDLELYFSLYDARGRALMLLKGE